MADNFEYSNFENLTSTLRHQTGLCVGNLVPHFQHIVTVGCGCGGHVGCVFVCDDVGECYDPVLVVPNCWELV